MHNRTGGIKCLCCLKLFHKPKQWQMNFTSFSTGFTNSTFFFILLFSLQLICRVTTSKYCSLTLHFLFASPKKQKQKKSHPFKSTHTIYPVQTEDSQAGRSVKLVSVQPSNSLLKIWYFTLETAVLLKPLHLQISFAGQVFRLLWFLQIP